MSQLKGLFFIRCLKNIFKTTLDIEDDLLVYLNKLTRNIQENTRINERTLHTKNWQTLKLTLNVT